MQASEEQRGHIVDSLRALMVDRATYQGFGSSSESSSQASSTAALYLLNTIDGQRQASTQLTQLHLFNQRFDSHYQSLILKMEEFQKIE